ncbi:MAG: FHA domain-containing protein [Clostridia bacterium]|nr:FHA domain-containing protein [Clostridia bacterium]
MDKATMIAGVLCIIVIIVVIVLLLLSLREGREKNNEKSGAAQPQGAGVLDKVAGLKGKISVLRKQRSSAGNAQSKSDVTIFMSTGWHIYTQDLTKDKNASWIEQGIIETADGWTIGRDEDCDICISSSSVSAKHIKIGRNKKGDWYLQNLSESTGTIYIGYQGDGDAREMKPKEIIKMIPGEDAEYYFLMGEVYLAVIWQMPLPMRGTPNEDEDCVSGVEQQEGYEPEFDESASSGHCGHSSPDDL